MIGVRLWFALKLDIVEIRLLVVFSERLLVSGLLAAFRALVF